MELFQNDYDFHIDPFVMNKIQYNIPRNPEELYYLKITILYIQFYLYLAPMKLFALLPSTNPTCLYTEFLL
uniref:Uncharacterized protein n=1 Tax=Podoviridae sp. ct8Lf7 TaxID=2827723 RepID=A0A8S5S0Q9_9CAUD|nr:MAG TPA: hypothetical protein [Podoviridae sp. ct8Lf7]